MKTPFIKNNYAILSGILLTALSACQMAPLQQNTQPTLSPVPLTLNHSSDYKTSVYQIREMNRSARSKASENQLGTSTQVQHNFGIQSVTKAPSPAYQSVFVRFFDDLKANGTTVIKARIQLSSGVHLAGVITDKDDSKAPNLKASDTLFASAIDPALPQLLGVASARHLEAKSKQDSFTYIDAQTLEIQLTITTGADDLRLVLDYGNVPAVDQTMTVTLLPGSTKNVGVLVGTDNQQSSTRIIPLTDPQGQHITDSGYTLKTPADKMALILLREGSTEQSQVLPLLDKNPNPFIPIVEPTPEPGICELSQESPLRPTTPQFLMKEDFSSLNTPDFADILTTPFLSWVQWGGDYAATPQGVAVWNPGAQQGDRLQYQEYTTERPDLLETGIYKKITLVDAQGKALYRPGDKLVAKFLLDPSFTHEHSDADIGLILQNRCNGDTVAAYGHPVRGPQATEHEIYVEITIPEGMTDLTVSLLTYLGNSEASSAQFKSVSVEHIPQNYYTETLLYSDNMDQGTEGAFGPNSPAVDAEFGYDFFLTPAYPGQYPGDQSVTPYNSGNSRGELGGLVKKIPLANYGPNSLISAKMFAATTFSSTPQESFTRLQLEFYNENDQALGTVQSTSLTGSHYEDLIIDRTQIPATASYVKFVPLVALGASESSSLLLDNFKLYISNP